MAQSQKNRRRCVRHLSLKDLCLLLASSPRSMTDESRGKHTDNCLCIVVTPHHLNYIQLDYCQQQDPNVKQILLDYTHYARCGIWNILSLFLHLLLFDLVLGTELE